jgi:hypothetical protein
MEATRLATTISGDLVVFVVCPLLVLFIAGCCTYVVKMSARLTTQDRALAVILQQVTPEGQPTLRDLVNQHTVQLAILTHRPSNDGSP